MRIPDSGIISLEGLRFKAFHGCLPDERREGGDYVVDVRLHADISRALRSDHLEDTLDLQEVFLAVKREMDTPSDLIEHVAARILQAVCKLDRDGRLKGVRVKVSKLTPPLPQGASCACSSVTLGSGSLDMETHEEAAGTPE